jgi:hypothetical protein
LGVVIRSIDVSVFGGFYGLFWALLVVCFVGVVTVVLLLVSRLSDPD